MPYIIPDITPFEEFGLAHMASHTPGTVQEGMSHVKKKLQECWWNIISINTITTIIITIIVIITIILITIILITTNSNFNQKQTTTSPCATIALGGMDHGHRSYSLNS